MENYTTLEQSRKLVGLGLDPKTADMYYYQDFINNDKKYEVGILKHEYNANTHSHKEGMTVPCWSIGQLIKLMPKRIECGELMIDTPDNDWYIVYFDWAGEHHGPKERKKELNDSCINMIVWLLENGYIKRV